MRVPNVLSIAGSDPSGGAGIQADLKTFAALGVYGMAAITALTAQNTQGVTGVMDVQPYFVRDQIQTIFNDVRVDAVKIGMLSSTKIIETVADLLEKYRTKIPFIVLDPVMVATSGDPLISGDAVQAVKDLLLPLCDVITPNIPEAEKLARKAVIDMQDSARDILDLGAKAVYLKGGHLKGEMATDVLATKDGITILELPRIHTTNTHGTGCTLSSALAACMAQGMNLEEAAQVAKAYLHGAISHAGTLDVGHGHGPVHHAYQGTRRDG